MRNKAKLLPTCIDQTSDKCTQLLIEPCETMVICTEKLMQCTCGTDNQADMILFSEYFFFLKSNDTHAHKSFSNVKYFEIECCCSCNIQRSYQNQLCTGKNNKTNPYIHIIRDPASFHFHSCTRQALCTLQHPGIVHHPHCICCSYVHRYTRSFYLHVRSIDYPMSKFSTDKLRKKIFQEKVAHEKTHV